MARITVEDCLSGINNRFELVLAASKRARQLAHGSTPLVETEHDKTTVIALREIAAGLVTPETLKESEREQAMMELEGEEQLSQQEEAEVQTSVLSGVALEGETNEALDNTETAGAANTDNAVDTNGTGSAETDADPETKPDES